MESATLWPYGNLHDVRTGAERPFNMNRLDKAAKEVATIRTQRHARLRRSRATMMQASVSIDSTSIYIIRSTSSIDNGSIMRGWKHRSCKTILALIDVLGPILV